ncbi:hypothetical protein [Streptomyces pseudogriseolus]|uniref:hypothetical protein n=1 Tax=Streptomyces pseudogriseolus TaxID=36817 RepID=UPI000A39D875
MAITLDKPNAYIAIINGADTDVIAVEPMPATDAEIEAIHIDAMVACLGIRPVTAPNAEAAATAVRAELLAEATGLPLV